MEKTISVVTKDNKQVELTYQQTLDAFHSMAQELNINITALDGLYYDVQELFPVTFETDEDIERELQENTKSAIDDVRKGIVANE